MRARAVLRKRAFENHLKHGGNSSELAENTNAIPFELLCSNHTYKYLMCILTYPSSLFCGLCALYGEYILCVHERARSRVSSLLYISRRAWIWAHQKTTVTIWIFQMYFVTIEHRNALFMRHGIVDYEAIQSPKKYPRNEKRIHIHSQYSFVVNKIGATS